MVSARLRRAPAHLLLHVRVAGLLLLLPVLIRTIGVQRTITVLTPRRCTRQAPWRDIERIQWVTDRLYRRRFLRSYGPCLRRSLTLYYFLTRAGYPVKVALGADLRGRHFRAHAWLTLDGEPILEPGSVDSYTKMAEWGSPPVSHPADS